MRLPLALAGALTLAFIVAASAHDHWISQGQYKSPIDGSACCGDIDCALVDPDDVHVVHGGLHVRGLVTYFSGKWAKNLWVEETVPQVEVQTSKDGQYWRCKKADDTRRCFFAPPPSL